MKKVITATAIAAAAALGGVGSASAAQPTHSARQDCRTYSSTRVCGQPKLNDKQRACATKMVQQGMTQRRAEVECLTFY
ncbi:hypothetical protein [Actinomadura fibrosa]|uniref:Uncharacterized protein n=1 Tax=Actinomadura fibrosa TaxID=111802 RepID=A0ABW2XN10_9ACTN|nr:hypothetical protein [Actinomadura fibrosa]